MYVVCMRKRTTIQIEKETLIRLKKARIIKRETYDEVINRLLKNANNIK